MGGTKHLDGGLSVPFKLPCTCTRRVSQILTATLRPIHVIFACQMRPEPGTPRKQARTATWPGRCPAGVLGAARVGSALTWLHEPGRGGPGGLQRLWGAGQWRSETLDGVALESASGQCASEVVDWPAPAHAAILWPLDLAWKVPEPVWLRSPTSS